MSLQEEQKVQAKQASQVFLKRFVEALITMSSNSKAYVMR